MTALHHPLPGAGLLTIAEAASRVGLSIRTLRRYLADGRLEAVRVGRRLMCSPQAVDAASVSGMANAAAKRIVDASWEDRSVAEWMTAWEAYFRIIERPGFPIANQLRYAASVRSRLGGRPVHEYRLEHLAAVHRDAAKQGWAVDEVAMMLALPPQLTVIDAVRRTQATFAGHIPPEAAPRRKARRKRDGSSKRGSNGTLRR